MQTTALVMEEPGRLTLRQLPLAAPESAGLVVRTLWSGVSAGTEKLLYDGRMPAFPGLGYPLVPGYETVGEVIRADDEGPHAPGDTVFVPGASCFGEVRGLFGGAASRLAVDPARVLPVDRALGADAVLLALAATAHHAVAEADPPELIVGHGALGRLMARIVIATGAPPPVVWEQRPERRPGADGYAVLAPDDDTRTDYAVIADASGDPAGLDRLIGRLRRQGTIVLAGFYADPVSFAYPPAFMREARIRIAAEWTPADLAAAAGLVRDGRLSLAGIVSHSAPSADAASAYPTAFDDPDCLKLILDWRDA